MAMVPHRPRAVGAAAGAVRRRGAERQDVERRRGAGWLAAVPRRRRMTQPISGG
jgi:hypothetical protein